MNEAAPLPYRILVALDELEKLVVVARDDADVEVGWWKLLDAMSEFRREYTRAIADSYKDTPEEAGGEEKNEG